MLRTLTTGVLALLIVGPVSMLAAEAAPAGNFKFVLPLRGSDPVLLLELKEVEGKLAAKVLAAGEGVPEPTIEEVRLDKENLHFTLGLGKSKIQATVKTNMEKEKPLLGVGRVQGNLVPVELQPTALKSLDSFDLTRESLDRTTGLETLQAVSTLLPKAAMNKVPAEEVRAWADRALKVSEPYGPEWRRSVLIEIAEILSEQEPYWPVALQYARQCERLLEPSDPLSMQKRILTVLGFTLEKTGKADEAKEIQARNDKLPYFKLKPFAGRKADSKKVVLVETFMGSGSPSCAGPGLALEGISKSFKPTEVLVLRNQVHFGGGDPLANPDTMARFSFYRDGIRGLPAVIVDGGAIIPGGGNFGESSNKYDQYLEVITPLLEKPARANLTLSAARMGNKIDIKTDVSEVGAKGNEIRLRVALVEEMVDYNAGPNRLTRHPYVVRSYVGGADGVMVPEKGLKKEFTVDLEDLRKKWGEYLDKVDKEAPFPTKERPLDLKKLTVVAFVQNDENGEILQAVQAEVTGQ